MEPPFSQQPDYASPGSEEMPKIKSKNYGLWAVTGWVALLLMTIVYENFIFSESTSLSTRKLYEVLIWILPIGPAVLSIVAWVSWRRGEEKHPWLAGLATITVVFASLLGLAATIMGIGGCC